MRSTLLLWPLAGGTSEKEVGRKVGPLARKAKTAETEQEQLMSIFGLTLASAQKISPRVSLPIKCDDFAHLQEWKRFRALRALSS